MYDVETLRYIITFISDNWKEILSTASVAIGLLSFVFQKKIFKGSQKKIAHFLFNQFFTSMKSLKTKVKAGRFQFKDGIHNETVLIILEMIEQSAKKFISDVVEGRYNEKELVDTVQIVARKFVNDMYVEFERRNVTKREIEALDKILYSYKMPLNINFSDVMNDEYYKTVFEKIDILLIFIDILILNILNVLTKSR